MPKKKLPRAVIVHDLDPYRHQVIFAHCRKDFSAIGEYLGGGPFDASDCDGKTIEHEDSKGRRIYVVGVFTGSFSVLAHECSHVALMLFDRVGINAHDSSGEAFCYLLQCMMDRFMPILARHVVRAK